MTIRKIVSAIVLSAAVVVILFLGETFLLGILLIIAAIAQWELLTMVGVSGRVAIAAFGCGLFALVPVQSVMVLVALCGVTMVVSSALLLVRSPSVQSTALHIVTTAAWNWIYIAIPLGFIARMWMGQHGVERMWFLIISTTIRNIASGLIGRLVGGHAISWVNPRKTYEGAAIGLLATVAGTFLVRPLAFPTISVAECAVLSLLVGVFGQMGDLTESMLKRQCGRIDSGTIFPGQGGVLDTIDSFLFTGPIFYFFFELAVLHGKT